MTIKRKIEKTELNKVIEKGGHVTADMDTKAQWTTFTLRIKRKMLKEIGEAIEDIEGLNKTGFMLQAIQEKLKRRE